MTKQKRMWLAATTSLVAFTSAIQAADDMQTRNLENRVSALEARKGGSGVITPAVNPRVKDGIDLFIQGSALLMQAREDTIEYVGSALPTADSQLQHASADWDWGFRVGIGYNLSHDGWDIQLNWMRIHNSADGSFTAAANSYPLLDPTSIASITTNPASVTWKAKFNILDFDLGRDFYVSKMMTVNPFLGVRSAWIRQTIDATYNTTPIHWDNNYWGLGIHTGLNGSFLLGVGLSLFGSFGYSLVYGNFHAEGYDTTNATGINNESRNVKNIYDYALGLRYRNTFADDSFGLEVDLAWERHQYPGQNQTRMYPNPTGTPIGALSNGDLGQRGWSLQLRFDF